MTDKRIVFTSRKIPNNSFKMRGTQMVDAMQQRGYNTEIVHPDQLDEVKNAVIIFVRRSISGRKFRNLLKHNILIIDPLDRIGDLHKMDHLKRFHAIVFPSDTQRNEFATYTANNNQGAYFLHHHWDPRLVEYTHGHFELGYWGYTASAVNVRNFVPRVNRYTSTRSFSIPPADLFQRVSCHYNVRDRNHGQGWRPTTKISTAAACGANIITSRDKMSLELLPHNYPYFIDGADYHETKRMIDYARATFGNDIWQYGLDCMARVRKFTSVDYCAKLYGRIIDDIIEKAK